MTFVSIVAFGMIAAMTLTSCDSKKAPANTEEPIIGTDYTLVKTPDGAVGIKKGETFIMEPKAQYTDITAEGGMFVAKNAETGYALLDPETGYEKLSADTVVWKDGFFEGQRNGIYLIYIPISKVQFAAKSYAVKGAYALGTFNDKISLWKDSEQLIEPTGDFAKMAVLPDGKILVLNGKAWGTATVKNKALVPGKAVTPKDLKKYKGMKGWDDKATVMILE